MVGGRSPVRVLEDAVRPSRPHYAHLNLARAYILLGDAPRAAEQIAQARAIRPTWTDLQPVADALAQLEGR
jgi:hypothetical protein